MGIFKSFKFLLRLLFLLSFTVLLVNAYLYASDEDIDIQTSIVILSIPHACKLLISNPDAIKTLGQDGTAESAFDAGYVDFDAGTPTLRVFANKDWRLSVKSSGFIGAPWAKPVGDLMLKDSGTTHVTNGFSDFKSLTLSDQEIASYAGGVNNEVHPCQYRILLDWAKDVPGTYTVTVTYTLSTNAS